MNGYFDLLISGLKQQPRLLEGRCASCHYLNICNGNVRVRAAQMTLNYWVENTVYYLSFAEIAVPSRH